MNIFFLLVFIFILFIRAYYLQILISLLGNASSESHYWLSLNLSSNLKARLSHLNHGNFLVMVRGHIAGKPIVIY